MDEPYPGQARPGQARPGQANKVKQINHDAEHLQQNGHNLNGSGPNPYTPQLDHIQENENDHGKLKEEAIQLEAIIPVDKPEVSKDQPQSGEVPTRPGSSPGVKRS